MTAAGAAQVLGDKAREAIDALGGYTYQLYQTALAWVELRAEELLFLEVAEDYATLAGEVLTAVQIKRTAGTVTINSGGVVQAIDSLFSLTEQNPNLEITVRFLTTSAIGMERALADRVGGKATLGAWRTLAKSGDLTELRSVLAASEIGAVAKERIAALDDDQLRLQVLRRIHFDCGAPDACMLRRQLRTRLLSSIQSRGGLHSQMEQCETAVIFRVLEKCIQHGERVLDRTELEGILERSTRVSISQADFDRNNKLISSIIANAVSAGTSVAISESANLRAIPSLPPYCVPRDQLTADAGGVVQQQGIVWLNAATGMGKTIAARTLAASFGGKWSAVSLRGYNENQTAHVLDSIGVALLNVRPAGVILDDLDALRHQNALDAFQDLVSTADRLDIPLIVTAASSPPVKTSFALGTAASISVRVPDFAEEEIASLVRAYGGDDQRWSRYVYLASGGGHPQLAEAMIRNLSQRGWPIGELRTLQSLLEGNPAVEEVRAECRRRLLQELHSDSLSLLQRLSVHTGSFDRQLAIAVAAVEPRISNAGLLVDDLVGPWIDQQDTRHFSLSPLLSGLGRDSLSSEEQRSIHYAIADRLTQGQSFELSSANSAALSAQLSGNETAITKVCLATLRATDEDLQVLGEHLVALAYLRDDVPIWPSNPSLSMMLRGAQLLLAKGRDDLDRVNALAAAFQKESDLAELAELSAVFETYVYVRLLATKPRVKGAVPDFGRILRRLHELLPDAERALGQGIEELSSFSRPGGVSVVGLAFFMQMQSLTKIDELTDAFDFVDGCIPDLRNAPLQPLDRPEFEADMLVRSPWLAEHEAKTIKPEHHAELFQKLEDVSNKWGRIDIAVSCCKFAAIIRDEYAADKEGALAILNAGLAKYGETNSELVRAKAKVYYRANEHSYSLDLSRSLIENNEINSSVERAFLGRDAGISAEKQGDFAAARKYYLYARTASQTAAFGDMVPMATGLLADAALAAWHGGDRNTCLRDYAVVLDELQSIDPSSSLRAAHCRAVAHHVLLWLHQQASGEQVLIADGSEPQIYPGCVSNPEPHEDIGKQPISAIEIAWYMLAEVECEAGLDCGIVSGLDRYLPKGRVLEGETVLIPALMQRSLRDLDSASFQKALVSLMAMFCHLQLGGGARNVLNVRNVTYGVFPEPRPEQFSDFENLAQLYVLAFCGAALVRRDVRSFEEMVALSAASVLPPTDTGFLSALSRGDGAEGFNGVFARLLSQEADRLRHRRAPDPTASWYLASCLAQCADTVGMLRLIAPDALSWASEVWTEILTNQRFRLVNPNLYVTEIEASLAATGDPVKKLLRLLCATLPTTQLTGQQDALRSLNELLAKHTSS